MVVAAVCCTGVVAGGVVSGWLLIAQRLLAVGIAATLLGGLVGATVLPAVKATGRNVVGISVAGKLATVSVPVIESVPGDAVVSCEPHIGQTISAQAVLAG